MSLLTAGSKPAPDRHRTPEVLRLKDGRTLEFIRHGDPHGVPVLFFHGFIGSAHQASFAHAAAVRHNVCLIAPSRPGVGRTSLWSRKCLADSISDIEQLTAFLGIDRFVVIGASGGTPYALGCLARLKGRVPGALVASGLGPIANPDLLQAMRPYARLAIQAAQRLPWATRWGLFAKFRSYRADPEGFLDRLVSRWPRPDRELFTHPDLRATFLADLHEVLAIGKGAEGLVEELQLYFRWGFDLGEISPASRVLFWHGTSDVLVPPLMARYMASKLPNSELTLYPGAHFMMVEHADEVLRKAVEIHGR